MIESTRSKITQAVVVNLIMLIVAFACIVPFLVVLSASFSDESLLLEKGYGILPRGLSLEAYRMTFRNGGQIISAYGITILTTAIGAVGATLVTLLAAYPLSRRDYILRKYINFYFYFTMLFSGGAIAQYIWTAQGLNLRNNILVLILPGLASAWNIFLMRTYLSQVPYEMIEAAKIDGAGEYNTLFTIIVPINHVALATIFVMFALGFWNQWYPCLMYFSDDRYTTLQYYLMRIMSNIDSILNTQDSQMSAIDMTKLPSETTRMAMCVVSAGPMIFMFSFFQKYFVGGITVGSVKG